MADKEELLDPTSSEVQKKIEEIKKKSQKTPSSLKAQLATREKLERDYLEDIIQVTFESSPGVNRMVESRRPNNEEYIELYFNCQEDINFFHIKSKKQKGA